MVPLKSAQVLFSRGWALLLQNLQHSGYVSLFPVLHSHVQVSCVEMAAAFDLPRISHGPLQFLALSRPRDQHTADCRSASQNQDEQRNGGHPGAVATGPLAQLNKSTGPSSMDLLAREKSAQVVRERFGGCIALLYCLGHRRHHD